MKITDKDLIVRTSQLPKAGKGLFTKVSIKKGARVTEYKGEIKTWKEVKDDNGRNRYLLYIDKNTVIDAENEKKFPARFANDARGSARKEEFKNNCRYLIYGKRAYLVATRNIAAGEEIFVGYGKEYWENIQ